MIEVYNLREEDLVSPEVSRRSSRFLLEADLTDPNISINDGNLAIQIQLRMRRDSGLGSNPGRPFVIALRPSLMREDESSLRLLFLKVLRRKVESHIREIQSSHLPSSRRGEVKDELHMIKDLLSSFQWIETKLEVEQILDLIDIGLTHLVESSEAMIVEVIRIGD